MNTRIYKSNRLFHIPLNHARNGHAWSLEDDKFVKNNYLLMGDDKMGETLKRTPYAVMMRRYKFGLIKPTKRIKYHQTIALAYSERNIAISTHKKVTRMRELISLAEKEENNYKKDQYKKELKKLSGL